MLYLSLATKMDQDAKRATAFQNCWLVLYSGVATLLNLGHIKTKQQVIDRFEKLANSLAYHLFS